MSKKKRQEESKCLVRKHCRTITWGGLSGLALISGLVLLAVAGLAGDLTLLVLVQICACLFISAILFIARFTSSAPRVGIPTPKANPNSLIRNLALAAALLTPIASIAGSAVALTHGNSNPPQSFLIEPCPEGRYLIPSEEKAS